MLPTDYDEPVYMEAATQFAAAIRAADWPRLLTSRHTLEHPALVKLLYALGVLLRGGGRAGQMTARTISLVLGTLEVGLLALLNPIAGVFLAIHTMSIKYTSQAYLEALPAFASLLAVLAYGRSARQPSALNRWLVLSAIALGVTAAGKYTYLVAGLTIGVLLVWRNRRHPWVVTFYMGTALLTFLLLDVQLWAAPLSRLRDSLLFHPAYSQSQHVVLQHLPWWQELYYLAHSIPWHPGVFLLSWDTLILTLAVLGLPFLYRRRPIFLLWLLLGIAALLLWPTKWPQYTLIVAAPLCLSAGTLLSSAIEWLDRRTEMVRTLRGLAPDWAFWIVVSIVVLALLVGFSYVQMQYATQMKDWTIYVTRNSSLPSDSVRALALDREGGVWAGTERGAALFRDGNWTTYDTSNSGLANDSVRALAIDSAARVWFGTEAGVSVLDGVQWRSYSTANSALIGDLVLCITAQPAPAAAGTNPGPVWFGTDKGLCRLDGDTWACYTPQNSGLVGARVLSIALDAQGRVWVGTWGGLSVLDGATWTSYTSRDSGLAYDTVSAVAIDARGQVWCGTLDGVSAFDGQSWRTYNVGNLSLPFNTATTLVIDRRGQVWVGADLPMGPLGGSSRHWVQRPCSMSARGTTTARTLRSIGKRRYVPFWRIPRTASGSPRCSRVSACSRVSRLRGEPPSGAKSHPVARRATQ